jgi:hypothetical protein
MTAVMQGKRLSRRGEGEEQLLFSADCMACILRGCHAMNFLREAMEMCQRFVGLRKSNKDCKAESVSFFSFCGG